MKTDRAYIISGGEEGKKRLGILAEVLYPYTRSLLIQQGLASGMSFLDAGCGGGHVATMAAGIVGKTGHVTAIDFDEDIIALNKKEAEAQNIPNIAYESLSAYDIHYPGRFDRAYARFLLSHLTDPLHALKNMMDSLKPGGTLIVEDIHFHGHCCHPASLAFDHYVSLFTATAAARGHNANIGPQLRSLLIAAGAEDVQFDIIQPAFHAGPGKWMAYITMDKIREAVMEQQLADAADIQKILDELETFTKDDNTIISLPRIFRAWGRKG